MKKIILATLTLTSLAFTSNVYANVKADITNGTYEVPTKNPLLKDSTSFVVKKISIETDTANNTFKLKYVIPTELTGEKNVVEFSGKLNQANSINYPDGSADCLSDQKTLMCQVKYTDLKINQSAAEQIMGRRFKGIELEKRLQIQKDFSTDPIGIIKINLK